MRAVTEPLALAVYHVMLPWSHAMPAVFRVKKLISEFEKAATIVYEQTAHQILGI